MVQIVTDSSVLYTEEEAKAAGFDVVPLCVSVGDMDGRDLQIDMEEFYGRIGKGEIPRSSQPPIGDVVEVELRAARLIQIYKDFRTKLLTNHDIYCKL